MTQQSVTLQFVLAGSLMFSMTASIQAQDANAPLDANLPNNLLLDHGTSFSTTTTGGTCTGNPCENFLFNPNALAINCNVGVNDPCILYTQVDAQALVLPAGVARGFFRFQVDGKTPTPGPTNPNGDVTFLSLSQGNFAT